MSMTVYDYTSDFFPDGHHVNPFYGVVYDYSDDGAREYPRIVGFPLGLAVWPGDMWVLGC